MRILEDLMRCGRQTRRTGRDQQREAGEREGAGSDSVRCGGRDGSAQQLCMGAGNLGDVPPRQMVFALKNGNCALVDEV